jgi:hypothetical protein
MLPNFSNFSNTRNIALGKTLPFPQSQFQQFSGFFSRTDYTHSTLSGLLTQRGKKLEEKKRRRRHPSGRGQRNKKQREGEGER